MAIGQTVAANSQKRIPLQRLRARMIVQATLMIKNVATIGRMLRNQMNGSPVVVKIPAARSDEIAQPPREAANT
jgi:hypothetical protein